MAAGVTPQRPLALRAGDNCLSVRHGRLWIDDVAVGDLARRFGTPLYVISETQLRHNARRFQSAFGAAWPEGPVLVMPSIKANFALAVRRVLTEEGTGCDSFGPGELEAALAGGVAPDAISLNGSSKNRELIERAVALGVRITVDSIAELDLVREVARSCATTAQIRLRVRPWLELPPAAGGDGGPSIQHAIQRYKPGIPTEHLRRLKRDAVDDGAALELRGVMAHIGRQGRDPVIWQHLAEWIGQLCGELSGQWSGWRPREIDIGGGFPMPRDPYGTADEREARPLAPPLEAYADAVGTGLRTGLAAAGLPATGVRLEVEPGRSLYGNAGLHLTQVRHIKAQAGPVAHRWIETDTSEIFLADAIFERNRWTPVAVDAADAPYTLSADLVGISCNPDLIVADAELPTLEAGDYVAFLDTGAYQEANASNFNLMPRPATVLVNGREADVIKRAERLPDLLERDVVPARLRGPGLQVVGLDHASVTCADLDRSLTFYRDLLRLPVLGIGESAEQELRTISGLADARVRWADLDLGAGRVLELVQFVHPASEHGSANNARAGQGHIALRVADVDVAHATLTSSGAVVRSAPVKLAEEGHWRDCRCFYALDPDGMTVEVIERPA